jgi:hypothetical protein
MKIIPGTALGVASAGQFSNRVLTARIPPGSPNPKEIVQHTRLTDQVFGGMRSSRKGPAPILGCQRFWDAGYKGKSFWRGRGFAIVYVDVASRVGNDRTLIAVSDICGAIISLPTLTQILAD